MYFLNYNCSLIPRGIEDAESVSVDIYIKLTWAKHLNGVLWIISFHD